MPLADFFPLMRPRPARVAVVYASREGALEAARNAKDAGDTGDADVRIVGPLERIIGNDPAPAIRDAWAVVVQPRTYDQCRRIVRALRRPWRRRRDDQAQAHAQSKSPAAAGLVTDRS